MNWLFSLNNKNSNQHNQNQQQQQNLHNRKQKKSMNSNYNNKNNDNNNSMITTMNLIKIIMLLLLMNFYCVAGIVWQQKGCHIVGHTQKIEIPGCINFELTSNACRGYCVSYSIPSNEETLHYNEKQLITSVGNCCTMTETEVMSVRVMCRNGPKNIKFKSATKCGCFHCKKY